jgi:putative ABC transport system substrate-binding protein
MKRRTFLTTSALMAAAAFLTLLAVVPATSIVAAQQRPSVARVAFLEGGKLESHLWQATRDGLRELGYVEGQNLIIEFRSANGQFDRVPELLDELIRLHVDVIVTIGDPVVAAAKQATSTIPIVMCGAGDPVGRGFVASLARPGGNITGISNLAVALTGKWLELAKEVVPRISRVAILRNGGNPTHALFWAEAQTSARRMALTVDSMEVRSPGEFEHAFASMAQAGVGAVVVLADPLLGSHRMRLAELSAKHHLASISPFREAAESGGLLSYGPSLRANFRRAATYVDRILKGAKPGDLPVEQPTRFELVINLKTAKALGLTIPSSLLLRADQVME